MAAPMFHVVSSSTKCLQNHKLMHPWQSLIQFNRFYCLSTRNDLHPTIPRKSVWKEINKSILPEETTIDLETIKRIETLALIKFANQEGIERLNKAIRLADQITIIDTTGIEPMYSLHEDRSLYLREDVVTEGGDAEEIMKNAAKTCEDYFVVPSAKGNS
ncbi:glutamyl-tRNA(Gln) amidotransferase subunit C, mitochondrial-like [Anneissia japonica]|uniref:glutamyl-tRNA(Gln) amidotransferase subunit C, mitochondrial-like n=1 Tax=Anneissia japonica TaxID=1529436 RepID=UPI0014257C88|nr:glutamyl-tRNA(Gln) amidotransferase subunit C, mitochondrial-like [Anneissia japonica]